MLDKKRVLHIIESASGGALNYVYDICNGLDRDVWEHIIIYSRRHDTPGDINEMFRGKAQLKEVHMTRDIVVRNDMWAIRRLGHEIRMMCPDIVHLHSSKAGALGRVAAVAYRHGIPTIYTPHGFAFMRKDISRFRALLFWVFEWILGRSGVARCLVGSQEEYSHATALCGRRNVSKILNSVEVSDDPPAMPQKGPGCPWIITVGRLTAAKNPELVLDVLQQLNAWGVDFKFIWVGDGELKDSFLTGANSRGIPVYVTGWLSRNEVKNWIQGTSVYIQPSSWEALPLALLEAMALRKPVVVSDIAAHRAIIHQKVNGLIAETSQQFAESIQFLLRFPQSADEVGLNAWRTVREGYSRRDFIQQIESLYQTEIDNRGLKA